MYILTFQFNSISCSFFVAAVFFNYVIFIQVGGLGDVVTGLGKALQKKGHLVEIVLPKYDCMQYDRIRGLRVCNIGDLRSTKIVGQCMFMMILIF